MNSIQMRFADKDWTEIAPGAKEKQFTAVGQTTRLVQFSPPFREVEPCIKAHVGFVVSGEFVISFGDSECHFQEGDAFAIPAGQQTAHRAIITREVTLFLVEPSPGSQDLNYV